MNEHENHKELYLDHIALEMHASFLKFIEKTFDALTENGLKDEEFLEIYIKLGSYFLADTINFIQGTLEISEDDAISYFEKANI